MENANPKVLHGVALVSYNQHSRESSFHNMSWNFASKYSSIVLCIALPISRSTFSVADETMEGILSSFICSICFNIGKFVFLLPLRRVDISDFPQSWSAKLQQHLLTKEDEQQTLSVHLVPLSEEAN